MARLVASLAPLRGEFDGVNPKRDRSSDGWIGDNRHAATVSDHNPDRAGIVHALDVDVDGVPMARIVRWIVARCRSGQETRLQYVIYRRTIWSRSWGWQARAYHGANPHTRHAHFSARYGTLGRDARPWGILAEFGPQAPAQRPTRPKPSKAGGHRPGSRALYAAPKAMTGEDVRYVQKWIGERCGPADGVFGKRTGTAVRWYQKMRGLPADGIVGPVTWRHLGVRWTGER